MTIKELLEDENWAQVFGDESSGNTNKDTDAVGDCPADPAPCRSDVAQILALRDTSDKEWDGWSGTGVFLLKDGRYLCADGGCDYTGWDCQAGNSLTVAKTLRELVLFGLSQHDRAMFFGLTVRALRPAELAEDTLPQIMADWLEDAGMPSDAEALRAALAAAEAMA